jgi:probable F420-dependent oxidoreductase
MSTLKFGFMVPRESDFDDDDDPYPRIYDYCARAEELGFDFCTFTHHRFSPERPYLSAPLVTMAAIAARTSRIELVTTVLVLPLYHPLDVAEAVAQLDQLSGGRVVLGVGAGYRRYEADAVGVPFDKRVSRLTESIDVLRAAWTHETVSFHGTHFDFDDVCVVPKPRRHPHPPIWIGALESKPVERAGRIADGWIAPSLQTVETLLARAASYRAAADEAGRPPVICLERDVVVHADRETARDAWLRRNRPLLEYYRDQGASLPDVPNAVSTGAGLSALAEGCAVAGTPEECVRAIDHARATLGCEYIQLMNLGTGPGYGHRGNYEAERAGLELFAREVLPAFR